jgi:hypothetical protein
MKKYHIYLLLIILFSAVALKVIWWKNSRVEVLIGDKKISVELRRTSLEWEKGLSGRRSLGESAGMLFVFPDTAVRRFWMKDMNFPIDIFWIQGNKVVGMAKGLPPPENGIIPDATSPESVNYVLETNAGFADKYNITLGSPVAVAP